MVYSEIGQRRYHGYSLRLFESLRSKTQDNGRVTCTNVDRRSRRVGAGGRVNWGAAA
jgi:hypothetical protein